MASLVVTGGPAAGKHFPLTEAITSFGRDDTCTFQILDEKVSRKHLQVRLEPRDGRHYAGDYRSANGVFVNQKQIVADVALADGDQIRIGNSTLMYLAQDQKDTATAVAAAKAKGEWKRVTISGDH